MREKIAVIGAGFSGISAACALAHSGFDVTVFEKNATAGGRASSFSEQGFIFDMGPSWYWMPDVFEWFFQLYGKKVSDYYILERLDPAYRIFFGQDDLIDIPAALPDIYKLFDNLEPGGGQKLEQFLASAEYKYNTGMKDLIFKPCNSIFEFADPRLISPLIRLRLFSSLRKEIHAKFSNEKLRRILEFPAYFLGAAPEHTPALYSLLNYADLVLGTWYPKGGMYKIIEGMVKLAEEKGVCFKYNAAVEKIHTTGHRATEVSLQQSALPFHGFIASADYAHVEQKLLHAADRNYNNDYWEKKKFAPSCLIYYLGIRGKIKNLLHHNLFFDASFTAFSHAIYTEPAWPADPLFYVCCPSKTDDTVAPEQDENLFILIPVAAGLEDTSVIREKYFQIVMQRLEKHTNETITQRVIFRKDFAPQDFTARYNSYKGNAYGLSNTLKQTAIFKPKLRNKKIKNLIYAGQLTVPGPGMPPAIISGYLAAEQMIKALNK